MNTLHLAIRSVRFYWRTHLGLMAGTAIATAAIVGALSAGDSIRESLRGLVHTRLGRVSHAVSTGNNFFPVQLSDRLSKDLKSPVAPVLHMRGTIITSSDGRRINKVNVYGVDRRFLKLAPGGEGPRAFGKDEAFVNSALSARLGDSSQDGILLRMETPGALPLDIPVASEKLRRTTMRIRLAGVLDDSEFGSFSIRADQTQPLNIFVSISQLAGKLGLEESANMLVFAELIGMEPLTSEIIEEGLRRTLTSRDLGLEVRALAGGKTTELRSGAYFIPPQIADRILAMEIAALPVTTYFVNSIVHGSNSTPYSFVSAMEAAHVPADIKDDEIVLNEWLAADLGTGLSDEVELRYYVADIENRLQEKSASFTVRSIVPISGTAADSDLMPVLPGLSDAGDCRDWDSDIPIDLSRIRDKDEQYWNRYRGTPKAFISVNKAGALWQSRFGIHTAIRFTDMTPDDVEALLSRSVDSATAGFAVQPVLESGLNAVAQSTDFADLFLGLSGFIVIAALILVGLLFAFAAEQRAAESGTLLALGFSRRRVRMMMLAEACVPALFGALIGAACGILYNKFILLALGSIWKGAVGALPVTPHVTGMSVANGIACGFLVSMLTMFIVLNRQVRRNVRELHGGSESMSTGRHLGSFIAAILVFIGAVFAAFAAGRGSGQEAAEAFFGAGALMLVGCMLAFKACLEIMSSRTSPARLSANAIGNRNAGRRKWRSLATICLVASGIFMVVSVGANRRPAAPDSARKSSGTGGFAFIGELSLPFAYDLNDQRDRKKLGLDVPEMDGVTFVAIRVKDGDDASCLNLNRAQAPRVLGVKPSDFATRGAFSFAALEAGSDRSNPWLVLTNSAAAVADQTVITWALGRKIGQSVEYPGNDGVALKLAGALAPSIFQGSLLISEESFFAAFPSVAGYRMFLADVPAGRRALVAKKLQWVFEDYGLELVPCATRLNEFTVVENTYLSIFLALGGIGLLLGTLGLGLVVLRNVQDRRRELAMLRAMGYSCRRVRSIVMAEHIVLLAAGMASGILSAAVAILPALLERSSDVSVVFLCGLLAALMLTGLLCTWIATRIAVRHEFLRALREE